MKYAATILRFALSIAVGQGGTVTPKDVYKRLIATGMDVPEYKVRQAFKEFSDDGMMTLENNQYYRIEKDYMRRLCEYAGVLS